MYTGAAIKEMPIVKISLASPISFNSPLKRPGFVKMVLDWIRTLLWRKSQRVKTILTTKKISLRASPEEKRKDWQSSGAMTQTDDQADRKSVV